MNITSSTNQAHFSVRTRSICRIFATIVLTSWVTACATGTASKSNVQERAQARWNALLAGDYDSAYSFYSPGYRTSHSRVDFELDMRTRKVRWVAAKVLGSTCEAEACTVETSVDYKVTRPVPGVPEWKNTEKSTERWVKTGGEWWYLPNN